MGSDRLATNPFASVQRVVSASVSPVIPMPVVPQFVGPAVPQDTPPVQRTPAENFYIPPNLDQWEKGVGNLSFSHGLRDAYAAELTAVGVFIGMRIGDSLSRIEGKL